MNDDYSHNLRFKPLLKLIFDNCNKDETCKYKIYQSEDNIISQNGLLTAYKNDIIDSKYYNYNNFTGPECFIKKGIISNSIEINNKKIMIHNTHIQSDSLGENITYYTKKTRDKQYIEIINYLKDFRDFDYNILCGDLNYDFNTPQLQQFVNNLPFKQTFTNNEKLITFPKYKQQLDYIIVNNDIDDNSQLKINYNVYDAYNLKFSDHNILECNIENL